MIVTFHPEAETELSQAIDYYEHIEPGLGYDFASEVYAAVQRAAAYPQAWAILAGNVRRSLLHRFPYGVLYSEHSDSLFILAVMNLHRDPEYWKDRQ